MPSGLTCKIYNGEDLTLRGFVLSCARQFGPGYRASQHGEKELPKDKAPILNVGNYHEEKPLKLKRNLKSGRVCGIILRKPRNFMMNSMLRISSTILQ